MLLSPAERVLLLDALPAAEGNAALLRGVRRLRKSLAFSDQEIADWHVVITPPTATVPALCRWDDALGKPVEIEVSPIIHEYVGQCLKAAEAAGRLREGLIDVYDQLFPEG